MAGRAERTRMRPIIRAQPPEAAASACIGASGLRARREGRVVLLLARPPMSADAIQSLLFNARSKGSEVANELRSTCNWAVVDRRACDQMGTAQSFVAGQPAAERTATRTTTAGLKSRRRARGFVPLQRIVDGDADADRDAETKQKTS
jgi:hypothetical protein